MHQSAVFREANYLAMKMNFVPNVPLVTLGQGQIQNDAMLPREPTFDCPPALPQNWSPCSLVNFSQRKTLIPLALKLLLPRRQLTQEERPMALCEQTILGEGGLRFTRFTQSICTSHTNHLNLSLCFWRTLWNFTSKSQYVQVTRFMQNIITQESAPYLRVFFLLERNGKCS
jgi:hypothetical protein